MSASYKKSSRDRSIDRSQYEAAVERNNEQVALRKNEYKRRQAIVEHPFGTIIRKWGFDYNLLKGFKKVDAEFSLIFLAYNFKRCLSIMGKKKMKRALKSHFLLFLELTTVITQKVTILLRLNKNKSFNVKLETRFVSWG